MEVLLFLIFWWKIWSVETNLIDTLFRIWPNSSYWIAAIDELKSLSKVSDILKTIIWQLNVTEKQHLNGIIYVKP